MNYTRYRKPTKPPKTFLSLDWFCFDAWKALKGSDFAWSWVDLQLFGLAYFRYHQQPKQIVPLVLHWRIAIYAVLKLSRPEWTKIRGVTPTSRPSCRHPKKLSGSSLKRMSDLKIHLKDSSKVFNLFNQHFGEVVCIIDFFHPDVWVCPVPSTAVEVGYTSGSALDGYRSGSREKWGAIGAGGMIDFFGNWRFWRVTFFFEGWVGGGPRRLHFATMTTIFRIFLMNSPKVLV